MQFLKLFRSRMTPPTSRSLADHISLRLEQLESRLVPYGLTGNAWPSSQLITVSFVPDGTLMTTVNGANVYSNLFATFDAKFGSAAAWQDAILTAAQTWAAQANINLSVVSDNGAAAGQGSYQQGDPNMGDIRIGGYAFSTKYLAGTYMPPSANNYSIAGDMNFNTAQSFNLGTTYDLQTVALHEFGHAFGLGHSTVGSSAVMWPYYNGKKQILSGDDVSGIQAIYGARPADVYSSVVANNSFVTATSLTSVIDPTALTALVGNLDISSASDVHYFSFTAPLTTNGTFTVDVQSDGLSLLRPSLTVYAADQLTVLGSATDGGSFNGSTQTVSVSGVTPGQVVYVKVSGADGTDFATGTYALSVSFGSSPLPTAKPLNTQLLDGTPLTGGGAIALAVADMMSVDESVPCAHSFSATGNPHGGGCGCPLCRPARILSDPFVGSTGTAFQWTVAPQTQQQTPTQVRGLDTSLTGDPNSPSTDDAGLAAFDAVFQSLQGESDPLG